MYNLYVYCREYCALVASTIVLLLGLVISTDIYAETVESSNSKNQNNMVSNFLLKFSSTGGFGGAHTSIFYNSTDNHLVKVHRNYDPVLPEISLSETLYDNQLSHLQQETLREIITDTDFFNISFKNDKPDCCDMVYYYLTINSGDKVNSVQWTSANYRNDSIYKRIPSEVTNIVETLLEFTENSTRIYTESDIDAIKFQKMSDLLSKANSLLAQKNYSQAIPLYNKVLEVNPNNTDALVYKAHALTSLGQHEKAMPLIDKALNIDSNDWQALIEKGSILSNLGHEEEALIYIDKALEVNPSNNARALIVKKELEAKIK